VDRDVLAGLKPRLDGTAAQPVTQQLLPGDMPMLPLGQGHDPALELLTE
jgi:hypothetical protein